MQRKGVLFACTLIAAILLSACGAGTEPSPDISIVNTPTSETEEIQPEATAVVPTATLPAHAGDYDEFEGAFTLPWTWRDENPAKWSFTQRPGYLRLYAAPYDGGGANILLTPVSGDFVATTRVLFEPGANFQAAGLTLFIEAGIRVNFVRAYCDFIPPCVGNGIYFDYIEEGSAVGENFATEVAVKDEAYLRLERIGDTLIGSYSEDGLNWTVIGTHNLSPFFASPRIGLFAGQDPDKSDLDIPADFDYFELVPSQ